MTKSYQTQRIFAVKTIAARRAAAYPVFSSIPSPIYTLSLKIDIYYFTLVHRSILFDWQRTCYTLLILPITFTNRAYFHFAIYWDNFQPVYWQLEAESLFLQDQLQQKSCDGLRNNKREIINYILIACKFLLIQQILGLGVYRSYPISTTIQDEQSR